MVRGYNVKIHDGVYFEVTFNYPSGPGVFIMKMSEEFDSVRLNSAGNNAIQVSSNDRFTGVISRSSQPSSFDLIDLGTLATSTSVTIGIERAGDGGIWVHRGSSRTQVFNSNESMGMFIAQFNGTGSSATHSVVVNPSATIPANAASGVVTLASVDQVEFSNAPVPPEALPTSEVNAGSGSTLGITSANQISRVALSSLGGFLIPQSGAVGIINGNYPNWVLNTGVVRHGVGHWRISPASSSISVEDYAIVPVPDSSNRHSYSVEYFTSSEVSGDGYIEIKIFDSSAAAFDAPLYVQWSRIRDF